MHVVLELLIVITVITILRYSKVVGDALTGIRPINFSTKPPEKKLNKVSFVDYIRSSCSLFNLLVDSFVT